MNSIHAAVSAQMNASANSVRSLYADPKNWKQIFPATISDARVVEEHERRTVVEVSHVEGPVINILEFVSPERIDLTEFKRRYTATFINEFLPEGIGMCFRITAQVRLKWPYSLLTPIAKPLVTSRMKRYVVEPLKAAAERARPASK